MSWGTGPWGAGSPWGGGISLPVPGLIAVSSFPDPTAEATLPAVVNEIGGTICLAIGTNFADPITVDILIGGLGSYTVVANGYVVDPRFDVESNRVFFGAPALVRGLYHLRVTTAGGTSGVLENVIAARLFADEYKTVSVRGKFSPKWITGPRILRG